MIIENIVRIGPREVSLIWWADFYKAMLMDEWTNTTWNTLLEADFYKAMLMDEWTNTTWNTLLEADFIYGGFGFHANFA